MHRSPRWRLRLLTLLAVAIAALGVVLPAFAQAQDGGPQVDILQLRGPVDPPVLTSIREVVADASAKGSAAVVLQLDSARGIAVSADEVVDAVQGDVPVVVWVGHSEARAAGAAAFLWAAADVRALTSTASVGPACPVTVAQPCSDEDVALLAEQFSAEPPAIAQQAVQAEALEGTADLVVDGLEPLLVELDGLPLADGSTLALPEADVTVRFHSMGLLQRVLHAALSPTFVYLLLISALLLFLFEAFQPGFGVAGVAGILLAPLAAYGFTVLPARWWALVLVIAGVLLLALDLAIAGLGVPTVLGALALALGSAWLFVDELALSWWLIGPITVACVGFFVGVMTVVLRAQAGPELEASGEELVGKLGVVRSSMNPEGHVFVAGALWRARYTGEATGKVRAGTKVRVHGTDGATLLVDAVANEPGTVDTLARST